MPTQNNKRNTSTQQSPKIVINQQSALGESPVKKPKEVPKYTLLEAFEYEQSGSRSTLDLQKALLACSYLLTWTSQGGNEAPDALIAAGLASTIEACAREVEGLFTFDDIYHAGGTPHEIREAREAQEAEKYRRHEERRRASSL